MSNHVYKISKIKTRLSVTHKDRHNIKEKPSYNIFL